MRRTTSQSIGPGKLSQLSVTRRKAKSHAIGPLLPSLIVARSSHRLGFDPPQHGSWWLFAHGVMPLYRSLAGSWLNMAESIQRILVRSALAGQNPETPEQIIYWVEAVARARDSGPIPLEWGSAKSAHRTRSRNRRHALGGSGVCAHHSIRTQKTLIQQWRSSYQTTH